LRIRGAVVDIQRGAKAAFQHVTWNVKSRRDGTSSHVNSIDTAFVEMPRLHGIAGAIVWILTDPAWAEDATIAYLQKTAFEMIRHDLPPGFAFGSWDENKPHRPKLGRISAAL
jgi:hypothetical protein